MLNCIHQEGLSELCPFSYDDTLNSELQIRLAVSSNNAREFFFTEEIKTVVSVKKTSELPFSFTLLNV